MDRSTAPSAWSRSRRATSARRLSYGEMRPARRFRTRATGANAAAVALCGGDFRPEDRDLMDAQIILGFEGRAYHVRDFYASQVLSMILGGGMSSRLFQEVRGEARPLLLGLCLPLGFFRYRHLRRSCGDGQSDIASWCQSSCRSCSGRVNRSEEELNRARAQYHAGLVMSGRKRCQPRLADRAPAAFVPGRSQRGAGRAAFRADRRAADRSLRPPVLFEADGDGGRTDRHACPLRGHPRRRCPRQGGRSHCG